MKITGNKGELIKINFTPSHPLLFSLSLFFSLSLSLEVNKVKLLAVIVQRCFVT